MELDDKMCDVNEMQKKKNENEAKWNSRFEIRIDIQCASQSFFLYAFEACLLLVMHSLHCCIR